MSNSGKALRHAHERSGQFGDILNSTKAIVFFGTPHQGSDIAGWGSFLGGLGSVIGIRDSNLVRELQTWSSPLLELSTVFADLAPRFQLTSFFEENKTNGVMVCYFAFQNTCYKLSRATAYPNDISWYLKALPV